MKNKKFFIWSCISILGISAILIPTITVPLVLKERETISDKLIDSYKNLFIDGSEEKINNLFFSKNKLNDSVTKEEIKNSIAFDKDTFLYKEVEKINNNLNQIDDDLVNEIYEMYQTEIANNKNRCGSIFKKHFWIAIYMKGRSLIINALSVAWWAIQLTPAIANFIINLDGAALADAFASFSFSLPDFLKPCLEATIKTIKEFKNKTNCKWRFHIWTQGIYI